MCQCLGQVLVPVFPGMSAGILQVRMHQADLVHVLVQGTIAIEHEIFHAAIERNRRQGLAGLDTRLEPVGLHEAAPIVRVVEQGQELRVGHQHAGGMPPDRGKAVGILHAQPQRSLTAHREATNRPRSRSHVEEPVHLGRNILHQQILVVLLAEPLVPRDVRVARGATIGQHHNQRQVGDMAHDVGVVEPRKTVVAVAMQLHQHRKRPLANIRVDDIEAGFLAQRRAMESNGQHTHREVSPSG